MMTPTGSDLRPTRERPLLVGLMVDVSGSMMSSIENRRGRQTSRLESFRDALEGLVKKAGELSREETGEKVAPLLKLFAYGFGFGGIFSAFLGRSGPDVRDLLALPGERTTTVPLDHLVAKWDRYRSHVEGLAKQMLGNTPMFEGFRTVHERFKTEFAQGHFSGQPVLFVLSDGEPTDSTATEVIRAAGAIKDDGVIIVACYVTSDDVAEPRHLYREAHGLWPPGAKLMLECASPVPPGSSFADYFREYKWTVEQDGKLFCQVNQSEVLAEFMNVILSPLQESASTNTRETPIRVFVSYSHSDSQYVEGGGIVDFLSGLKREGFEFWYDRRLVAGDAWDASIKQEIKHSDIALVLVSQAFLNSAYCIDVEVSAFLETRAKAGCVIFPVIVSPCDWKSHAWLTSTQFEPRDGHTIETDFKDRGSRDQLYLRILEQLRLLGRRIRETRSGRRTG